MFGAGASQYNSFKGIYEIVLLIRQIRGTAKNLKLAQTVMGDKCLTLFEKKNNSSNSNFNSRVQTQGLVYLWVW